MNLPQRLFLIANALLGVFCLTSAPATAGEPRLEKADLFEHPDSRAGYEVYHIPGIVVTTRGTVLAYCEARKGPGGDWSHIDILLRRSTDGGKTWDAPRPIAHRGERVPRSPLALARKLGSPDAQTVNNPAPIVDRQTGAIHFLYCIDYAHAFYMRSDDDGLSFSRPVEITPTFEEFRPEYPWTVLATGPNHGIQMKNGRLVVPVWLSTGTGGGGHRPSVTSVIYSDDHGATWHRGAIAVPNTAEFVNPNETVAVQLADGRVMLNVRNESKTGRRLVITSPDGATGWSTPRFDDALIEPICMAAIIRLSEKPESDRNRIVFANPNTSPSGKGTGVQADRKNLSAKLSYDEGETWPVNKTIEAGSSGYSDLAVLPDGTILCYYGRGTVAGQSIFKSGALTMARFNLEWLTDGKDSLPATPGR